MKWLFVLLLIANGAFWGFTRLEVPPKPLDRKSREINADKLQVITIEQAKSVAAQVAVADKPVDATADQTDAAPSSAEKIDKQRDKPGELLADAKAPDSKNTKQSDDKKTDDKTAPAKVKTAMVCFAWHGILDEDLPNVRKKVSALNLGGEVKVVEADSDAKVRYWVYIPPRGTAADAQKKVEEIKALGVGDFFVVNDGGKWQNAISLGLFASRDAADRRLETVKDMGVRSAVMHQRNDGTVGATLLLRHVPKGAKSALTGAASGFRGSSVAETDC